MSSTTFSSKSFLAIKRSSESTDSEKYLTELGVNINQENKINQAPNKPSLFKLGAGLNKARSRSYQYLQDNLQHKPIGSTIKKKTIPLPQLSNQFEDLISSKVKELHISYELKGNEAVISGEVQEIEEFEQFLQELKSTKNLKAKAQSELKPLISKTLTLHSSILTKLDQIKTKVKEYSLTYDILNEKISISGPQESVLDFVTWIYEFTLSSFEDQNNTSENGICESEISASPFHRMERQAIEEKAQELELSCDFGYDIISISGKCFNMKEFKSYLHEVEATCKKVLYPKFWNFRDFIHFSEIIVENSSEEFAMVADLFCKTMQDFNITKLVRIQNKYLMENYITMVQKRKERYPDHEANRKLLFHGTRHASPRLIYQNSDTGFDLQFANTGAYGRGLYFAVNADYSHNGFCHEVGKK